MNQNPRCDKCVWSTVFNTKKREMKMSYFLIAFTIGVVLFADIFYDIRGQLFGTQTRYVFKLTRQRKQKAIVITTFMRSGSTFLGELFNLHSQAFYQFEPLHNDAADMILDKRQLLNEKLHCHFHNLTVTRESQRMVNQGNFIFRRKSRRLCQPPFCDLLGV